MDTQLSVGVQPVRGILLKKREWLVLDRNY